MTQPHLIQRITEALKLTEECKKHDTPSNAALHKDVDGKPKNQSWHHRSVVGMMIYLASTTRPDMLFSVHQAVKFCSDPKKSHEEAVERVGRCLKKKIDKGMILKFDQTVPIEVHVDADFAGAWDLAESDLLASASSRAGCVMKIANCPIHWVSKMQSEVALPTAEAECIALPQSTRDLMPIKQLVDFLNTFIESNQNIFNSLRGQQWCIAIIIRTKAQTSHQAHMCQTSSFQTTCQKQNCINSSHRNRRSTS